MIVTIDGPAGAGKSTIAKRLADRLRFRFLDTGAMYRAVAWAVLQANVDLGDAPRVESIANRVKIDFRDGHIFADDQDITEEIRTSEINAAVPKVAGNAKVREILVRTQQAIGRDGDIVTEGRDQGTTVFPEADCKIYLTASAEVRARRRYMDLLASGESVTFGEVLESQNERDTGDQQREIGPLAKADNAIEVITDEMSHDEVLVHLEWLVRSFLPQPNSNLCSENGGASEN